MEIHQKKKKIDLKEQNEQKEKEKVHLFKKRVFQSKYIKKEDKIILRWNNIHIIYWSRKPKPFKDFQKDSFRWKQLDANHKHNTNV